MSTYKAPLDDIRFVLFDLLHADTAFQRLGFNDATRDILDAVMDEGARFCETVLAPLNAVGDQVGCTLDKDTGAVTTPPGYKEAYAEYAAGGWAGLSAPEAFGGQGLPHAAGIPIKEMIDAANLSWGNFPLLSHGATEALLHHGEDWQREALRKVSPTTSSATARGTRWRCGASTPTFVSRCSGSSGARARGS
jgi:alkylation response protein AidB-like acyl-CoA dehydrogenase